jgi:PIN domain nuclease of toxin-antitoxin system
VPHAQHAGTLPGIHRDPFDRMFVARAQLEGPTVVNTEALFDRYGVRLLW